MKFIGHRGMISKGPENSRESILHAIQNYDGVEIDIVQLASGELLVMHDFTLERTTINCSQYLCDNKLQTLNWNEISHVKLFNNEPPLCLDEVFYNFNDYNGKTKDVFIEIKCPITNIEKLFETINILKNKSIKHHLISFDIDLIINFRDIFSLNLDTKYHLLCNDTIHINKYKYFMQMIDTAKKYKLDGIQFISDPTIITPEIVKCAQDNDLLVTTWVNSVIANSNTEQTIQYMKDIGVEFFTGNV